MLQVLCVYPLLNLPAGVAEEADAPKKPLEL